MLPGDYKRKYKFKSNNENEKRSMYIATIIAAIAFLLIWFFVK